MKLCLCALIVLLSAAIPVQGAGQFHLEPHWKIMKNGGRDYLGKSIRWTDEHGKTREGLISAV